MVSHERETDPIPDHCENCRTMLQIITVRFALLRARAVFACPYCALAYVEPERRIRISSPII
jgi:hypothetical protein